MGEDELVEVDRGVVAVPGDIVGPCREREQRRAGSEVRGRASRRPGLAARLPRGKSGAGRPEGEDSVGIHRVTFARLSPSDV